MHFGLVHYPQVDLKLIDQIRRKYDPTVDLVQPHITVMFLVPESEGEGKLAGHLQNVLGTCRPIPIRMRGLCKTPDHWLLLTIEDGNPEVIKLYGEIYTGMLAKYRRDDIQFIPHVGLGLFVKKRTRYNMNDAHKIEFDEPAYRMALREAEDLRLDYRCVIDRLHLVKIPDDVLQWTQGRRPMWEEGSRIVRSQEFLLSGTSA